MKRINAKILSLLISAVMLMSLMNIYVFAVDNMGSKTGYICAEDVKYVEKDGIIANFGARNELCTFLTKYAKSFYDENNSYDALSEKKGSAELSKVPESELYKSLGALMTSKHTHKTNYGETRDYYCMTDCTNSDYNYISSFYSCGQIKGIWDSGKTWNREHTWPKSKSLHGDDENDIMMLRPTLKSENSQRGNAAYGISRGFFDPGKDTRGDCARICLYVYVRYGNTERMFGSDGVMESLDILLQWMEEDPVDTFEMGRNDSVQSITGTRNVFVDYPEYAFLLFGKEVPENMETPSKLSRAKGDLTPEENPKGEKNDESMSDALKTTLIIAIPAVIIALGAATAVVVVKKKKKAN